MSMILSVQCSMVIKQSYTHCVTSRVGSLVSVALNHTGAWHIVIGENRSMTNSLTLQRRKWVSDYKQINFLDLAPMRQLL